MVRADNRAPMMWVDATMVPTTPADYQ